MEYDSFDLKLTRSLSPLKSMSTSHLLALLDGTSVDALCAGDVLFTAGHYDDQHIYLLHGEVTFTWPDGRVAIIRAGETILPLSSFQPCQVTAVANTDCSVLRISRERLDKLLTWSAVADYLQLNLSLRRELDDDIDWIMSVLRSNLFFKVSPLHVEDILARLESQTVLAGEVVIRQGDVGDHCFFIREGEAEVSRYQNGVRTRLADVGPGRCIGEDALVNKALRNASVTMRTDGCLMKLSKKDFLLLLQEPAVDAQALSELRDTLQGGAVAVDVRSEEEYIQSHIRQAVNVPLDLLGIKARLLNKKTTYITYCDTGRRSRAAAFFLRCQGFNAFALSDCATLFGFAEWQDILETNNNYLLREGVAVPGQ